MRAVRRPAAVAAAVAIAGAAALTGGAPASASAASGGWSISPGGPFTATARPWGVTDTGTGSSFNCASLALHGQLMSGANVPGPVIGDFDSATVTSCTGPLGITFALAFPGFPWSISATGYTSGSDTVTGTISGVGLHLSGVGCTADFVGASGSTATLDYAYANPTHQLTITGGDGRIADVSGTCLGLFDNGDPANFDGVFDVEPPQLIRPAGTPSAADAR